MKKFLIAPFVTILCLFSVCFSANALCVKNSSDLNFNVMFNQSCPCAISQNLGDICPGTQRFAGQNKEGTVVLKESSTCPKLKTSAKVNVKGDETVEITKDCSGCYYVTIKNANGQQIEKQRIS